MIFLQTAVFTLFLSLIAVCQVNEKGKTQNNSLQKCAANSNGLYDRKKVIKQLAKILNKSIPEWKEVYGSGYGITENEHPAGFFIYDLTDTANKDITSTDCIEFKENHIYHFAPFFNDFSLSHILILENGSLKVFKSINCKDRGDKLEDVIAYLSQKLASSKNKDEIIDRVKNYRKYGSYLRVHKYSSLVCQEISDNEK